MRGMSALSLDDIYRENSIQGVDFVGNVARVRNIQKQKHGSILYSTDNYFSLRVRMSDNADSLS